MTPFRNTIKHPVKNKKGFTLLELIVVIVLISILASIAIANYLPFKRRVYDATARSDARNVLELAVIEMLNNEDIDYDKGDLLTKGEGGAVGDSDTSGNFRTRVFVLSSGVRAVISGDSNRDPNGDTTILTAIFYHIKGTDDPAATIDGKREYTCFFHEGTGVTILP